MLCTTTTLILNFHKQDVETAPIVFNKTLYGKSKKKNILDLCERKKNKKVNPIEKMHDKDFGLLCAN